MIEFEWCPNFVIIIIVVFLFFSLIVVPFSYALEEAKGQYIVTISEVICSGGLYTFFLIVAVVVAILSYVFYMNIDFHLRAVAPRRCGCPVGNVCCKILWRLLIFVSWIGFAVGVVGVGAIATTHTKKTTCQEDSTHHGTKHAIFAKVAFGSVLVFLSAVLLYPRGHELFSTRTFYALGCVVLCGIVCLLTFGGFNMYYGEEIPQFTNYFEWIGVLCIVIGFTAFALGTCFAALHPQYDSGCLYVRLNAQLGPHAPTTNVPPVHPAAPVSVINMPDDDATQMIGLLP